jgi:hypothetical protein
MGLLDPYPDHRNNGYPDTCPNCRRDTAIVHTHKQMAWPAWTNNLAPPMVPYVQLNVWVCTYCGKTTIVKFAYPAAVGEEQFREPESVTILLPDRAPRELPAEAPEAMRSLYREASQAESAGAMRGAAALYRAAVEELVTHRQAQGANLYEKIDALEEQGVDHDIVEDLHEARLLGNWSLHEGLEFSAEEVADVASLIADAVHTLYVQPAEREAMRQARQARREAREQDE